MLVGIMSLCARNWHDIACKHGYVGMSVKEIYNEWYETLCNEEMDCISVLKEMIGEGDHVMFLILMMCYILSMTYAPIS